MWKEGALGKLICVLSVVVLPLFIFFAMYTAIQEHRVYKISHEQVK